jgi:hypothetical protein
MQRKPPDTPSHDEAWSRDQPGQARTAATAPLHAGDVHRRPGRGGPRELVRVRFGRAGCVPPDPVSRLPRALLKRAVPEQYLPQKSPDSAASGDFCVAGDDCRGGEMRPEQLHGAGNLLDKDVRVIRTVELWNRDAGPWNEDTTWTCRTERDEAEEGDHGKEQLQASEQPAPGYVPASQAVMSQPQVPPVVTAERGLPGSRRRITPSATPATSPAEPVWCS